MQQTFVQTFGVEFEFVFAFHQEKLHEILDAAAAEARPVLIKAPHHEIHRRFLQPQAVLNATAGRKRWPSWVFKVNESAGNELQFLDIMQHIRPRPVRSSPEVGALGNEWKKQRIYIRDYFLEHLKIANKILGERGLESTVIGCMIDHMPANWKTCTADVSWPEQKALAYSGKEKSYYEKWIITNDSSIVGATKGELRAATRGLINEKNQGDWDSHGMELVSRVFSLAALPDACEEIALYLSALMPQLLSNPAKTDLQWAMIDSVFAGTHVHIGLNWKSGVEVDLHQSFIRHLLFILLSNEELISHLHPRRRRGIDAPWSPVKPVFPPPKPNETDVEQIFREKMEEEIRVNEVREKFVSQDGMTISQNDLAKAVFDEISHRRTTQALLHSFQPPKEDCYERQFFVSLSNLREMVDQGKYLNIDHASNGQLKPTIEFRQHACMLDAHEVKHWIKFCQAIVQLAERQAQEQSPNHESSTWQLELKKYPATCSDIGTLTGPEMLNMEPLEMVYWQERHAKYRGDEQIELRNRMRRRAERIRAKRKYGLSIDETEREQLRAAHEDLLSDPEARIPADYKSLSMPSREEYQALDIEQLKLVARHRDSLGERQMRSQRKEDYICFIQDLDRLGQFGDGTRVPKISSVIDGSTSVLPS